MDYMINDDLVLGDALKNVKRSHNTSQYTTHKQLSLTACAIQRQIARVTDAKTINLNGLLSQFSSALSVSYDRGSNLGMFKNERVLPDI